MEEEAVEAVADGRVCTGKQAQEMGLVDEMGYLPDVIDRAAELGGIDGEPRIIEYKRQAGFFQSLGSSFNRPSPVQELKELLHYQTGSPLMYLYTVP
jgi:protease-4